MAKADAKDRHPPEELLNILYSIADRLRIAGTIRQENAIGFEVENVLS
jgi:hypothetical protein